MECRTRRFCRSRSEQCQECHGPERVGDCFGLNRRGRGQPPAFEPRNHAGVQPEFIKIHVCPCPDDVRYHRRAPLRSFGWGAPEATAHGTALCREPPGRRPPYVMWETMCHGRGAEQAACSRGRPTTCRVCEVWRTSCQSLSNDHFRMCWKDISIHLLRNHLIEAMCCALSLFFFEPLLPFTRLSVFRPD